VLTDLAELAELSEEQGGAARAKRLQRLARAARRRAQPLYLGVSPELGPYFDPSQGGDFLPSVARVRAEIARTERWTLPRLQIAVEPDLAPRRYEFRIWGEVVAHGSVPEGSGGAPLAEVLTQLWDVAVAHTGRLKGDESAAGP